MKKETLGCLMLLSFLSTFSSIGQSGNWEWAESSTGTTPPGTFTNQGYSVATDYLGNAYITGFFNTPTISFGSITLTNAGVNKEDIFVAKYDKNGNVKWAKSAGGNSYDMPNSIAADKFGNVFITGFYRSPSITFGTTTFSSAGDAEPFLVKYDSLGNVLWAKTETAIGTDVGYDVTTDESGNSYITGYFTSPTITFGATTLTNASSIGSNDLFLVKYDINGNVLWATNVGGTNHEYRPTITTDSLENVYLAGHFVSPSMTVSSFTLTNAGNWDIFAIKYDSLGTVIWAKSYGGINYEYPNSIATNSSGIFLVGGFAGATISFDTVTLYNASTSTTAANLYITKLDFSGNTIWAKSAGGQEGSVATSVSADVSSIYITGFSYDSLIVLDGISLLFPGEYTTLIIAKYLNDGSIQCATSLKNKISTNLAGVSTDNLGNVFLCSNYSYSPFLVGSDSLTDAGGWSQQVFLAKYNCDVTGNFIDELRNKNNFTLYPNPTQSQFTVFSNENKIKQITVTDVSGKQIQNEQIVLSDYSMKVSLIFPFKGVYFVQIYGENKIAIKKIIVY